MEKKVKEKTVFISELDEYLFGNGIHYEIYKKLGAHPSEEKGKKGIFFAVWAPNAVSVSVIGEFNNWEQDRNVMDKLPDMGIWHCFVPGAGQGQMYKYYIVTNTGEALYKADPYACYAEERPGTASSTCWNPWRSWPGPPRTPSTCPTSTAPRLRWTPATCCR